ncbi:MAG: Sir2 family NAD-dependent protein deacetylase [bacterium]
MTNIEENIELAAKALKKADAIIITAGAGMGVDSGLPDFRGNEGFWKAYPPIAKLGISFSGMANPQWFTTNPKLAWGFYGHRLNLYRKTEPHSGFTTLLKYADEKKGKYFVFTSNVDGQFQKAGFDENQIAECHGSIHHLQCHSACTRDIWSAEDIEIRVNEEILEAEEPLPKCIHCGSIARPNILMFGDWNWLDERTSAQETRLDKWLNSIVNKKIVIVECGAGSSVPTVRYKSESVAASRNATLIRINPREYQVPHGHISIPLGAKEGIEKIFNLLNTV